MFYIVSYFIVASLICMQSFFGIALIHLRDVGGVLFGGIFYYIMFLTGWIVMTIIFAAMAILRVTGAIIGLILSSSAQGIAGGYYLINYPDDNNGNLIFSPQPNEIVFMITLMVVIIFSCLFLMKLRLNSH